MEKKEKAKHSLNSAGSLCNATQPTVTEAEAVRTVIGAVLGAPFRKEGTTGGIGNDIKTADGFKTLGAFSRSTSPRAPTCEQRVSVRQKTRVCCSILDAE